MIVLHWIFTNGHRWHKQFDTVDAAKAAAHAMGLIVAPSVDRVFIETETAEIWLREKN
jgi:hypothetical protein